MENGTIPSTVVDSGCTSGVRTSNDPCRQNGRTSKKNFVLPGGEIVNATKIAEYPFKVGRRHKSYTSHPGSPKTHC